MNTDPMNMYGSMLNNGSGFMNTNNNYTNPDMALFRGANRPRDQHGFPIVPGGQVKPLNYKKSVSGFFLDQFVAMGVKIIPSIVLGTEFLYLANIPLNSNLTQEEKEDIRKYCSANNKNSEIYLNIFDNIKKGQKECIKGGCATIKGGEIVIKKAGTYYIQYTGQYFLPNSFDNNTLPYQKVYSGLHSNGGEIQRYGKHIVAGGVDTSNDFQITACKKGERLGFGTRQTAGDTTLVMGTINIVRFGM